LTSSRGNLPRVAILGRPNVGKSTLFNAILGRRRAITHSDPGVTRDPVGVECVLAGTRLELVDTGGYMSDGSGIDGVVADRSLKTAAAADLVLLVLDALETTPEDREYMRLLRPWSEKLLLVVNKVDTPDRDSLVWNAYENGFSNVIGVSAAHGRSLDRLKEEIAQLLVESRDTSADPATAARRAPESSVIRIAILGKPNTGKSSLSNRLTGEERSIVSSTPGTTRDVVEGEFTFHERTFRIMDTAGIRRKSRVTDPIEYYSVNRAIESISNADLVLLMIDSTEGLVDQDKKIAAQAIKEGRGIVIVLNKWDLLKDSPRLVADVSEQVRFQFPVIGFAPIVPVSAKTGYGIRSLLDTCLTVWNELHQRVGTGRLNTALEAWVTHYSLPVRGKNYKIRFVTQVSANPVRFVAFVNKLSGFPMSYNQYLENCIRRDLGFSHVPVSIEFAQSKKNPR
jgi:GTPase